MSMSLDECLFETEMYYLQLDIENAEDKDELIETLFEEGWDEETVAKAVKERFDVHVEFKSLP